MATIAVTDIVTTGSAVSGTACEAGGDKFAPGDNVFVEFINISGSSITVTIASPKTCNQGGTHNLAIAVANLTSEMIGPLPPNRFAGSDGLVACTYSSHTGMTIQPQRIGG